MLKSVYITTNTHSDKLCSFLVAFAGIRICSKLPIDSPLAGQDGGERDLKRNAKIFEKGVDFLRKVRYNLFLHKGHSMPGSNFREQEVESMPNIKSSKKDVISSKIAYEKNKANKSELKTNLKKFDAALVAGDKAAAEAAYKVAVKAVDQAVVKGVLHKNNAARKKSSMTLKINKLA